MMKVSVLYGRPDDPEAFEEYYANNYLPLAAKIPSVQRFESGKVIATPDRSEPPYHRIAELWFESEEQMQSSLGSEEREAAVADIPNFATGAATTVISEVET